MSQTKIVATVGPASRSRRMLGELIRAGVDVFRLNFSHGTLDEHEEALANIREAARQESKLVAVMGDLCGPKIRVGPMAGGSAELHAGQRVIIQRPQIEGTAERFSSTYPDLVDDVVPPAPILIDDGLIRLRAVDKTADELVCEVEVGGVVRSRKGINLPATDVSSPTLGAKDRRDARWVVDQGLDFLALSFVRSAEDIRELRKLVQDGGSGPQIVAKIEKPEAIDHLEEIVSESDAVLVARGDLGVEMDVARVPMLQKEIARLCHRQRKPVIIATQMLQSMVDQAMPTRAEASDVANAVLDGADAVMLSAETAIGKHPVNVVRMMNRIALESEAFSVRQGPAVPENVADSTRPVTDAVVRSAAGLARQLGVKVVAVWTTEGNTVRLMSKYRLRMPIVGLCSDQRICRRMVLYYGTIPVRLDRGRSNEELLTRLDRYLQERRLADAGEWIVLLTGRRSGSSDATRSLVVHQVGTG